MWIFGIIFLHLALHGVHADKLAGIEAEHQEKSPHWVDVCGGSYLFSEDRKSWADAVDQCELYFSHLVQIDSLAENFCLLEYAHTQGIAAMFWHSGNDIVSEGVFRQGDGEMLDWQPLWVDEDPNQGTAETVLGCILIYPNMRGKW
eukprot:TRINITY_DN12476_c0_g1_i1.p1 TRINITY_DN12476_c0_g1~~TRINITY_DN12476_c0_g1_i1.p1  ORF type:complete len:146 (-),score=21.52 TRINITY_DN12476_c0_g1_i1:3-440(-)